MAVVYRAHDEALKREVAVKILHGHLLSEPESKARLAREAHAVAKLQHDNIVQIYDCSGPDSKASYIVTEFIDGQTLKQFVGDRRLPFPELAALAMREIGSAVAHAHQLGILHRDIKPENVMVRKDGVLKLMDFGVAQVMDMERMTVTGQLIGSPAYMAPELIEGRPVDVRTDVFSLGIMLYQLATGALPFTGRNPHEVFKRITDAQYPDPRTKCQLIGDGLAKVIARALARKPEDRYASVGPLLEDLRRFCEDAGLGDPRAELSAYFADPEAQETLLKSRIATGLLDSGRRARRERRTAAALELWNRALAGNPSDDAVMAEIKALEGGRRIKRALWFGGATAGLISAVLLFLKLTPVRSEPPPRQEPRVVVAESKKAPPTPPAPVVAVTRPVVPPPIPLPARPRRLEPVRAPGTAVTAPVPVPGVEEVELRLAPYPTNVEVFVDGVSRGSFGPDNESLKLPWDRSHEIEFRNPGCCYTLTETVGPDRRPEGDVLRVRLAGKPAYLIVTTDPPAADALILITETTPSARKMPLKLSAKPGEQKRIAFDPKGEMAKSLTVTVKVADDFPVEETITVTAGKSSTLTVKLSR
jgi:serine/threonine-protein kinase